MYPDPEHATKYQMFFIPELVLMYLFWDLMSNGDQVQRAVDELVACEQRIAELRHELVTTADSELIEQLPPLYQRVIEHELDEHGRFQPD
jgi:hypothetical protein